VSTESQGPHELPIDSDVEVDDITPRSPRRPVHLRWAYIALVAAGGALGTGVREALSLLFPTPTGGFPLTIFVINVTGAFILGMLLELLRRRGPDEGHRRRLRLFIGTGILGGYTTYSTLAVGTVQALTHGNAPVAVVYALLSVIAGVAAAFLGIVVGATLHRRTAARTEAQR
jgi:CrcB protein